MNSQKQQKIEQILQNKNESGSLSNQVTQRLIKLINQSNKGEQLKQLMDHQFCKCIQTQVDRLSQINPQNKKQIANNNTLTLSVIKNLFQLLNETRISQNCQDKRQNDQKIYESQGSTKTPTPNKNRQMKMFLCQQIGQIKVIAQLLKGDNFSDAISKTKTVTEKFLAYGHQQISALLIGFVYQPVLEGLSQRANQLKKMLQRIPANQVNSMIQNVQMAQNGSKLKQESNYNSLQEVLSIKEFQKFNDFLKEQKTEQPETVQLRAKTKYVYQKRQKSDKLFNSIRDRIDQVSSISQKMNKIKQNLKNRPKDFLKQKKAINKTFDL